MKMSILKPSKRYVDMPVSAVTIDTTVEAAFAVPVSIGCGNITTSNHESRGILLVKDSKRGKKMQIDELLHTKVDHMLKVMESILNEKEETSFHKRQVPALQRQSKAVEKINFILEFIENRSEIEQSLPHAWQVIMSVITHDLEDLRELLIGTNKS